MHGVTRSIAIACSATLLVVLTLGGCPWADLLQSDGTISLPQERWALGGDNARLIVVREPSYGPGEINLLNPLSSLSYEEWVSLIEDPPPAEVVVVDRATLQPITRLEIPASAYSFVTDGKYLAWAEEDGVHVRDLLTSEEHVYLAIEGADDDIAPVAFAGTRLLARAGDWSGLTALFLVDLTSGEESVPLVGQIDEIVAADDLVALQIHRTFDPNTQDISEFFVGDEIQLWNLATDERRTIVEDVDDIVSLRIDSGKVIWHTESYNESDAGIPTTLTWAVRQYDPQTDTITDLASESIPAGDFLSPTSPTEPYTTVSAISSTGLVLNESTFDLTDPFPTSGTETLIWSPFGGDPVPLLSSTDGLEAIERCSSYPRLVDNAVVYVDPADCTFRIYNTSTGETRSFDPFTQ